MTMTSLAILGKLLEDSAILFVCLFLLSRLRLFRRLFQKEQYSRNDYLIIAAVFAGIAVIANYSGLRVDGSLANVRTVTIVTSGMLFGPGIGITTGLIAGLHRYAIDLGGATAMPCLLSSILAGIVAGFVGKYARRPWQWFLGILVGMLAEVVTMVLIFFLTAPHTLGIGIIRQIGWPMILSQVSIGLLIMLIQRIEDDKERVAAFQSQLALTIARETLPYFHEVTATAMERVCQIIRQHIGAAAVAMTEGDALLAYDGLDKEKHALGSVLSPDETVRAVAGKEIVLCNQYGVKRSGPFQSVIVIPLKVHTKVMGTLHIYYTCNHGITYSTQVLAEGLCQLMSTQLEVAELHALEEMAHRSERKALQAQIAPHFLFNSLHAIASLIRIQPDKARELIANLASYLRFNIELDQDCIDIQQELRQVDDFIAIEKARFGDKIHVVYDIDDVAVSIPSLSLEPLVENAIVHGILKQPSGGTVLIEVKDKGAAVQITVADTGVGMEPEIIEQLAAGKGDGHHIGLYNVDQRLRHMYGKGLTIERLQPGTRITFSVPKTGSEELCHE